MLLEELFQEGLAGSRVRNLKNFPGSKSDYEASKRTAADVQNNVDTIKSEVGPNEYMQGALDNLRSGGDPEKAELADKIENNYYDGEIGISGISPHERDTMMQTGMQQYYADRAEWAAMTPEEKKAHVEQAKKKAAEERKRKEAEQKKKEEEKRNAWTDEIENNFIPG